MQFDVDHSPYALSLDRVFFNVDVLKVVLLLDLLSIKIHYY